MKLYLTVLFTLITLTSFSQVIWSEDFQGEANGSTSGTAVGGTWSTTYSGTGTFSKQSFLGLGYFEASDLGTEAIWTSNVINISATGYATIDVITSTIGTETGDYLIAYYKVDGGPETQFFSHTPSGFTASLGGSAIVQGNTVQVVIRVLNNVGDNFNINYVEVSRITTLYSRANADWNTAGTWSTVAVGGASCGCVPGTYTRQVIGGGNTVTLSATSSTTDLDIQNGRLRWLADNIDLNVTRRGTLTLSASGIIDRNGFNGAQIDYDESYPHAIVNNGTFNIGDLDINAQTTLTISGSANISVSDDFFIDATTTLILNGTGTITVADDMEVNATTTVSGTKNLTVTSDVLLAADLTNNLSGTFATGRLFFEGAIDFINNGPATTGTLQFDASNGGLINNSTITISGNIVVTTPVDNDNTVTNASGATLSFAAIDANNGDLIINNSGTINQSGNFNNLDTGSNSDFNNLATGIWNWTLTPNTTYDTDMATILDCTASGNTFNYSAAGAQRIIPVTYHHLTLSNTGAKDANNASFAVRGNWLVSGTASFTEGTGTITLDGTGAQTVTNPSGETFNNLIINNSSATSPQITFNNAVTVTGTLTMTDGNIYLNSNTFTLGSSTASTGTLSHTLNSANGWMYGGTIRRYFANTAVTIGTAAGFFPMGTSSDWKPFFISKTNTVNSGGLLSLSYNNTNETTSDVSIVDDNGTIVRRHNSYWTSSIVSGITAGTFAIQAGGTGFGTITSVAHLRLCQFASEVGTTSLPNGGTTLSPLVNKITLSPANLNNNFHIGSVNSASPLPIVLAYFKARVSGEEVITEWLTRQEIDNDFFTIQKTTDFETFYDVAIIDGRGTTREEHKYSVIDKSPIAGRSYYRLKQTDFDGKFSYSEPVMIDYEGPSSAVLSAYPNPFQGTALTIEIKGLKNERSVPVCIYNLQGKKVFESILNENSIGAFQAELMFNQPLPRGIYILKAGQTLQLTRKITVD